MLILFFNIKFFKQWFASTFGLWIIHYYLHFEGSSLFKRKECNFGSIPIIAILNDIHKDDTKQLTDRQHIILDLICEDDTITISQMIQKIQVSEITIKRELSILKKMGILERIGGRKEGKWLITKR